MDLKADRQLRENTVKVIHHPDGNHRVVIFQRKDGTFDFEEERFWDEENSWATCKKATATVTDTLEQAVEEARGRVEWMKAI